MIIDFHTHIFPDALAPRAIASLQATAGLPVAFDGTADGLIKLMKEDGIDKAVVLNTVTNAKQEEKVNNFALEVNENKKELIPFCSLHPDNENPKEKLLYFKSKGIKGVKLHPDYLGIEFDDERFEPIISAISEIGLPVVIHTGYDPVSPNKIHATPDAILNVLDKFPSLILVAAHLGGVSHWDEVIEKLCGKNLYLDTAFCCERIGITVEQGKKIFEKHPHEKILFGSDAPWARPAEIIEFLNKLGLSEETLEKVLHKNAEGLVNL
ncbi:MAG: amidohydrolase family protein [Clostridia bacterium]|nr:amidohydrolase family protein [Clostridia bacterium]